MWAEQYHGDLSDEGRRSISNPALAGNLRGKLLLVRGELDDSARPYQPLRLVDALISPAAGHRRAVRLSSRACPPCELPANVHRAVTIGKRSIP